MFREIVINAEPGEMRLAALEDAALVEFFAERDTERRRVGEIYKGRVNKVLPGMEAAFVDVGLPKAAFLHTSDMLTSMLDFEKFDLDEEQAAGRPRRVETPIQDLLEKGQDILVQIVKEPIGTKGAKVSGRISLPGRFLVLMPGTGRVGVSRKIADPTERQRLKKILRELRPKNAGLIGRTVSEGQSKKDLAQDVAYLAELWKEIEADASTETAPVLVHRDLGLATGLMRDLFSSRVDRVVIDSKDVYKEILRYVTVVAPELRTRVKLFTGGGPIFDEYGIETEIQKSFEEKVWLKKGGYVVIQPTEAMVTIDVNTGRFTGKRSQEDTILQTNLEAAREVARQLRLRDLGGIIVVDFIDMEEESNRRALIEAFRSAMQGDRARVKIYPISELGLMEMTRQRVREPLLHYFSEDCAACRGTGKTRSLPAVGMRVERSLRRIGARTKEKEVQLWVSPDLAVWLFDERGERLEALEKRYGFVVDFQEDPRLRRDEFKIVFPRSKRDVTSEFEG